MIYEMTVDNLLSLMRSVKTLSYDQIKHFFRDAEDYSNLDYYLDQLRRNRIFDIDEKNGVVMYHGALPLKLIEMNKRIQAFWVVASFGSKMVKEVMPTGYPSQFVFVTHDEDVYDLTYCITASDAQLAYRDRKLTIPDGTIDTINHIAIVNSVSQGEALSAYKFDSFCVLDANKNPVYYNWE